MTEQLHLIEVAEQKSITPRSKYQKWKLENNYRKADNGMRCANCVNIVGTRFYKCRLLGISSSSATDIRLSYVCNRFEEYMEK